MDHYRLDATCPRCGVPTQQTVYATALLVARPLAPQTPLLAVRCHVQHCGTRYDLFASAFHGATPYDADETMMPAGAPWDA
jgi:hypothetical protein